MKLYENYEAVLHKDVATSFYVVALVATLSAYRIIGTVWGKVSLHILAATVQTCI